MFRLLFLLTLCAACFYCGDAPATTESEASMIPTTTKKKSGKPGKIVPTATLTFADGPLAGTHELGKAEQVIGASASVSYTEVDKKKGGPDYDNTTNLSIAGMADPTGTFDMTYLGRTFKGAPKVGTLSAFSFPKKDGTGANCGTMVIDDKNEKNPWFKIHVEFLDCGDLEITSLGDAWKERTTSKHRTASGKFTERVGLKISMDDKTQKYVETTMTMVWSGKHSQPKY